MADPKNPFEPTVTYHGRNPSQPATPGPSPDVPAGGQRPEDSEAVGVAPSEESMLAALEDYAKSLAEGRRPDPKRLLDSHAARAAELAACLDALELVQQFGPAAAAELRRRAQGRAGDAAAERSPEAAGTAAESPALGALGDFRLLRELGRGGMGVVYEAEQVSLGRRVALKVLPFAAMLDRRQLARFKNEAHAAAGLHHTHIVPVYSFGCQDGVYYYAMQYIEGQTLSDVIARLRSRQSSADGPPLPRGGTAPAAEEVTQPTAMELTPAALAEPQPGPAEERADEAPDERAGAAPGEAEGAASGPPAREGDVSPEPAPDAADAAEQALADAGDGGRPEPCPPSPGWLAEMPWSSLAWCRKVAEMGVQVADALEHAHEQGILHRDVKPGNLLLDAEGAVWVTDFGLAQMEAGAGLTLTGDIVGTLRYMSPEQAEGRRGLVDHRGDVYSLGVTLYELLTLQPAFGQQQREPLLAQVLSDASPPAPVRLNRAIPRDLETIVLKAASKDPRQRYQTAADLAADLRRFLDGRPILARRPTVLDRLAKWARRHTVGVAVGAALLVLAVAGLTATSLTLLAAYEREHELRQQADDAAKLEHQLRQTAEGAATAAAVSRQTAEESQRLAEQREATANRLLYAARMNVAHQALKDGHVERTLQILGDYCEPSKLESLRSFEWYYLLAQCYTEELVIEQESAPFCIAFAPSGEEIAAVAGTGFAVYDATTGSPRKQIADLAHAAGAVAYSPDGRILAVGLDNGEIQLWDTRSWHRTETLLAQPAYGVTGLAYSPTGRWLAVGTGPSFSSVGSGDLQVWELADNNMVFRHAFPDSRVSPVTFNSDETMLAVADHLAGVKLWHTDGWKHHGTVIGLIHGLAFVPNENTLAVQCGAGVVLYDTESLKETAAIQPGGSWTLAVSPDGTAFAVGHRDDPVVLLLDKASGNLHAMLRGHTKQVLSVAFSPDGRRIAGGGADLTLRIWQIDTTPAQATLHAHSQQWSTTSPARYACPVAFSPDGRTFAVSGTDHVEVYDCATMRRIATIGPLETGANALGFSPDGRRLAVGGGTAEKPGRLTLWDVATRAVADPLDASRGVFSSVAFSSDGSLLAAGTGAEVKIWDAATGRLVATLGPHVGEVSSVAFCPEQRTLAASTLDSRDTRTVTSPSGAVENKISPSRGEVAVWSVQTGRTRFRRAWCHRVLRVAYSPDGSMLATAGHDMYDLYRGANAKVWHVASGKELATLVGHGSGVTCLTFSPDGRVLATTGEDSRIRLWDTATWQERLTLSWPEASIVQLAFAPDGSALAATTVDGEVRFWHAPRDPDGHILRLQDRVARLDSPSAEAEEALRVHMHAFLNQLSVAETYGASGRFDEAIALYEQTIDGMKATLGDRHHNTLTTQHNLAVIHVKAGRFKEAIGLFEQTLAAFKVYFGDEYAPTLDSQHMLAVTYYDIGRLDEAIALYEKTLDARKATLGHDHLDTLATQNRLAEAYRRTGRLDEAITLYEKTLHGRRSMLGHDHVATVSTQSCLAVSYSAAGRHDEALVLDERTLEATRARHGDDHPNTLTSQENLALTYAELSRLDEAVVLLKKTLDARKATLGHDHLDTLATQNRLAEAYRRTGRLDEAITLYEKTLHGRRSMLGHDHVATVSTQSCLAVSYSAAGRHDEALVLNERTLEATRARHGDDHPNTLTSQENLALTYAELSRLDEADVLLKKTLAARKATLGDKHPVTLTTQHNLAVVYGRLGQLDEAIALYEKTLKARKARLGGDHPTTHTTQSALAAVYRKAGRPREAIPLYEQTLAATRARFGEGHRETLTAQYSLAVTYAESGRLDEAIVLLEQILGARNVALRGDDFDTLGTQRSLAAAYAEAGRLDEAIPLWRRTLEAARAKFGDDHLETLTIQGNLAANLCNAGLLGESIQLLAKTLDAKMVHLGNGHPQTLRTQMNLGAAYFSTGQHDKAAPLFEQVLARKAELGDHHPHTLNSQIGLAWSYEDAGRLDEALALFEQALATQAAKLGDRHPTVAMVQALVGHCRVKRKEHALAEPILRQALKTRQAHQPDAWSTFNTQSILGEAVAGGEEFDAAETLLLAGFQGMATRSESIPANVRTRRLREAAKRLVDLYTAWGKPEQAEAWQTGILDRLDAGDALPLELPTQRGGNGNPE